MPAQLLAPWPQQVEPLGTSLVLDGTLAFSGDLSPGDLAPALLRLTRVLAKRRIDLQLSDTGVAVIAVASRDPEHPAQGYRLVVDEGGIEISAADPAGAFYALQTLAQWIELQQPEEGEIAGVRIRDWPDLTHRGVLLDISRTRVPTMETLFDLVDLLSSWKINQLQLYTEHTFAFRGHESVWRNASPMTAAEIRSLDDHCFARHVELVPNQNSFGHLHRWLRLPEYRHLAECPEGLAHPFASEVEPFSLCPIDPGSLDLLRDLYGQLLPNFRSRQFNVGFDETFDLGRGRSAAPVEAEGVGRVYLRFLEQVRRLAAEHGHRIQYWGDIVAGHPEIIAELSEEAIVMSWGYEADHDFEKELRPLVDRGLAFYVCPGTSSWLSFGGRVSNALGNIAAAVRAGVNQGAIGCLVTDWGDQGHLQPLPVSMPGFLAAAACSWNASAAEEHAMMPIEPWLAHHVFPAHPSKAAALLELGELYSKPGARAFNGSPLFHLAVTPDLSWEHSRIAGTHVEGLQSCLEVIEGARSVLAAGEQDLVSRELAWVCSGLELGVEVGLARLRTGSPIPLSEIPTRRRQSLRSRLDRLLDQHQDLWRSRSRPGGRLESRAVLERARKTLDPEG